MKVLSTYSLKKHGKKAQELQTNLSTSEVSHLFQHLQMRYAVLETTNILLNFAESEDLKAILKNGIKILKSQVETLQSYIKKYALPTPLPPPYDSKTVATLHHVSDEYIYRRVLKGIQSFINSHTAAFIQSSNSELRQFFKEILLEEINIYDKFFEYGKFKGYTSAPPMYRK